MYTSQQLSLLRFNYRFHIFLGDFFWEYKDLILLQEPIRFFFWNINICKCMKNKMVFVNSCRQFDYECGGVCFLIYMYYILF